jgi:hypothetical protein
MAQTDQLVKELNLTATENAIYKMLVAVGYGETKLKSQRSKIRRGKRE